MQAKTDPRVSPKPHEGRKGKDEMRQDETRRDDDDNDGDDDNDDNHEANIIIISIFEVNL